MKMREIGGEDESEVDDDGGGVVVGQIPTVSVPRHIKKRSLKNKALNINFSEKDLMDYVTGFHKRKRKRRKEAQRQLKEKDRLKRIAARKRRKEEKEKALYGGASQHQSATELEPDNPEDAVERDELQTTAPISETKKYESDCTTITVTTSELDQEDDDLRPLLPFPKQSIVAEKDRSLSVVKKKPLKGARRQKARKNAGKPASGKKDKKDKRKGKSKR